MGNGRLLNFLNVGKLETKILKYTDLDLFEKAGS